MVHLSAIDLLIGGVTDPSIFQVGTDDEEKAKALFKDLIDAGDIKGYRINTKHVFVTEDKRLEVLLPNGKRQEIKFPLELKDHREKIIEMISARQGADLKASTLSYEQYCQLVFGKKKLTLKKQVKWLCNYRGIFSNRENVISQPCLAKSRRSLLNLEKEFS